VIPERRWDAALHAAAVLVCGAGCVAWMLPRQVAASAGAWAGPGLSMAALALSAWLALRWRWLRAWLIVLIATLCLAWLKVPGSATAASHLAGASLGLLLMLLLGRFASSVQRLRIAMLAFLGGGLVVLAFGLGSIDARRLSEFESLASSPLAALRLQIEGLEKGQIVNTNALAAAALLFVPLGASVLLRRSEDRFDRFVLKPAGLVVVAAGTLVFAVSNSRSAWAAAWLTVFVVLLRDLHLRVSRILLGTAVLAQPFAIIGYVHWISHDDWIHKADVLWWTVYERTLIVNAALERLQVSPWLGIGLNQFRHLYKPVGSPADYDVAHAHNVFLQTALDVGVVGLVAYCCVLGYVLLRAHQAAGSPLRVCRTAAFGGGLALVAVTAFGLADAVALGAKLGMFQWAAAGIVLGAWRMHISQTRPEGGQGRDPAARYASASREEEC